jgi:hypothetical protein
VHIDYALLRTQIDELLPPQLPEYISHVKLRAKLAILRADLLWLLDAMDDCTHPYVSTPLEHTALFFGVHF